MLFNRLTTKYSTMKILLLTLIVLLTLILSACSAPAPAATPAQSQSEPIAKSWSEISVQDAATKRDAGAFILDVRQPEEWLEIHVPGAKLIPLGELESRLAEVPKDKEIVVMCRSGNRSKTGAEILSKAGFTNVSSMAGGINDWSASGFPTTTGP